MNREITDVLNYCRSRTSVSVMIPFVLDTDEMAALRNSTGIIEICEISAGETRKRHIRTPTPDSRSSRRETLFAGPCALIPPSFLRATLASGRLRITCRHGACYRSVLIPSLLLAAWRNRILRYLRRLPEDHPAVRVTRALGRSAWLRRIWRALSHPDATGDDEDVYRRILGSSTGASYRPIGRRIVHVNAGLAAGGTERQIVLTLQGLKQAGFEDLTFLGQQVFDVSGLDFHAPRLREAGIAVAQVGQNLEKDSPEGFAIDPRVMAALGELPRRLMEDVHALTLEFLKRRPEIVHAWQDPSSVAAGLAGVIAGTPRIVLSCRNVNPSHFDSYQPYMRPAWRALSALPQVRIVANSQAGAADYAEWLDLPADRIMVIRNGLDINHFGRPPDEKLNAFRRQLGIPDKAPLIGGVFRFWPEKRPELWIETAGEIAKARPDARFLLVGSGPLRRKAMRLADQLGIAGRCAFLGERQDVVTAIAACDVLLLTSAYEGLPNVLVEAQALAVPIVTTDAGGAREAVEDGITGSVVKTASPRALAGRTIAMLENPQPSQNWKDGQARILNRFSRDKMIAQTIAVYNSDLTGDRSLNVGS